MADNPKPEGVSEQIVFFAGIGNICLQWALLEHTILYIIAAIEGIPDEKAFILCAHLDMKPRINLSILLAQAAKLPHQRFVKPLMDIRKAIDKDGSGLAERRNMFVHGTHKAGEHPGEFVLTMSRWKGDKRSQTVTALDAGLLGNELSLQAQQAHRILADYGVWKFGTQQNDDSGEHITQTKATIRLIRAKQIKRALKVIWANLKG